MFELAFMQRIRKKHFCWLIFDFNIDANLLFIVPTRLLQKIDLTNYFNHWSQPNFYFLFSQHRRMRSNELNYLGNSLLGMLIKIIPISNEKNP